MRNVKLMVPTEIKTRLDKMNLLDRFLFEETVEDPEIYNAMVEILMDGEPVRIVQSETEKELRISPQLREVRLDVIGVEAGGDIYQMEMQKKNTYNLPKRSRYYQAQMDVSLLEPGAKDFNLLNDVTTILVAPFDVFGHGLYRYTFEENCLEIPGLKLNDGARRIFINTKGENSESFSQEFLDFMSYINDSSEENAKRAQSDRIKKIHNRVKQIKISEKTGVKLMQKWEELAYAREDGVAEGETKLLVKMVCAKLSKGYSTESIAEQLEVDLSKVTEIAELAEQSAPDYDVEKITRQLVPPVMIDF